MAAFEYISREYFRCFSIMGQFPVFVTDRGCVPSTLLRIYNVALSVLYTTVTLYILTNGSTVSSDFFYFIVIRLLPGIGHCVVLYSSLVPAWRVDWTCGIFSRLNSIDVSLSEIGYVRNCRMHKFVPILSLVVYMGYMGFVVITEYIFPWWVLVFPQYSHYFYWFNLIMFFILNHLVVMTFFIVLRFQFVNQKLETMETASRESAQKMPDQNDVFAVDSKIKRSRLAGGSISNANTIRILQKCHYQLCELSVEVTANVNVPITLIVVFTFIELLVNTYTAFSSILIRKDNDLLAILTGLKWASVDVVRLLSIVVAFTSLEATANRTAALVHALYLEQNSESAQRQLHMFSMQLTHHKLEFTPWGLFRLNSSLLVSIAGAVTTYLVIILQLSQQSAQNNSTRYVSVANATIIPARSTADS